MDWRTSVLTGVSEIFFRKDEEGNWVAYDRNGNSIRGATKEHARNNYYLAFGDIRGQMNIGFDMSNVERKL